MFAAAIPGALASIGSGLFSYWGQQETNEANRDIAREANQANIATAREQMAFQERMSNTAFQRARNDMVQAGINPVLMASKGMQANSPAGSGFAATTGAPMVNPVPNLSAVLSSSFQLAKMMEEIKNLKEQNRVLSTQGDTNVATARKLNADAKIQENIEPKSRLHGRAYQAGNQLVDTATGFLNDAQQKFNKHIAKHQAAQTSNTPKAAETWFGKIIREHNENWPRNRKYFYMRR